MDVPPHIFHPWQELLLHFLGHLASECALSLTISKEKTTTAAQNLFIRYISLKEIKASIELVKFLNCQESKQFRVFFF